MIFILSFCDYDTSRDIIIELRNKIKSYIIN